MLNIRTNGECSPIKSHIKYAIKNPLFLCRNRGFFMVFDKFLPPADCLVSGEYLIYQDRVVRIIFIKLELVSLTVAIKNLNQCLYVVIWL